MPCAIQPPAGLCDACREAERTGNRRGSQFILCGLSRRDPSYPRYPRLPVLECAGFKPIAGETPDEPTKKESR